MSSVRCQLAWLRSVHDGPTGEPAVKWRRQINVLRAQRIADLRFRAQHDATYSRLLATELVQQGGDALRASRTDEARTLLDEAVSGFRAPGSIRPGVPDRLLVTALGLLAAAGIQDGRLSEARAALLDALETNQEHDALTPGDTENLDERARILVPLAVVQHLLDEPRPARATINSALSLVAQGAELDSTSRQTLDDLLKRLGPDEEPTPPLH